MNKVNGFTGMKVRPTNFFKWPVFAFIDENCELAHKELLKAARKRLTPKPVVSVRTILNRNCWG
jgi:hypothetical protein